MKNIYLFALMLFFAAASQGQNQSYTICQGSAITLTANSYPGITNITYSINPGGQNGTSPLFNVTPSIPTSYTLYTSGNNGSANVTYSYIANVTVIGTTSYSLSSVQNFTLGCSTKSAVVVKLSNIVTNPQGAGVTFSLMAPWSGPVQTTGLLKAGSDYTITAPGPYSVVIRTSNAGCDTYAPFVIIQNTMAPVYDSIKGVRLLTCDNPSTTLVPVISGSNIGYVWSWGNTSWPGPITVLSTTAAPTQTLVGNFSLTLTDQTSLCNSKHLVQLKQNIFPPVALVSGIGTLTCKQPTLVLANQSMTGIPPQSGYPTNNVVIGYLWEGPTPQIPLSLSSTYTAGISGVYTLTEKDLNNGCMSKKVVVVGENMLFPVINYPNDPPPANICGGITNATLTPVIASNSTNLSYTWTAPANAIVSNINSLTLITNLPGVYTIMVQDNFSGCISVDSMLVVQCVGVNENIFGRFKFFPNPADEVIYFSSDYTGDLAVIFFDVSGKVVMNKMVNGDGQINIRPLEGGIYFVKIMRGNSLIGALKVVKN